MEVSCAAHKPLGTDSTGESGWLAHCVRLFWFSLPARWMNNTSLGTLDLLHVYGMHDLELMAEICG